MDLEEKLLFQRQQARLAELESWLALLIVAHGESNGFSAFKYEITWQRAEELRNQMPRAELLVSVDYDFACDRYTLDAL